MAEVFELQVISGDGGNGAMCFKGDGVSLSLIPARTETFSLSYRHVRKFVDSAGRPWRRPETPSQAALQQQIKSQEKRSLGFD